MKRNDGVFTMYDAVLFFVFLLLATAVLSVYATFPSDGDHQGRISMGRCMETRRAVLASTISETYYNDGESEIVRRDISVRALILEQIYLEREGVPRDNFSYPNDIRVLVNRHLDDHWALSVSSSGIDDLIIHRGGITDDIGDISGRFRGETISSELVDTDLADLDVEIVFYIFR